jgi:hypothetical protein
VGLRFRERFPQPCWPADWWQRNCDLPILDPDAPDPVPLCGRQLRIPAAPGVVPGKVQLASELLADAIETGAYL